MRWFFALNEDSSVFGAYADLVKVAVHTALTRTSLRPHFIYDGRENALTGWLREKGVAVIPRRTSFCARLQALAAAAGDPGIVNTGGGALLRVDLPRLTQELGMEDEFILYTDCDVMFLADVVPALRCLKPRVFAVAPEARRHNFLDMNTGVMVMNLAALRREAARFDAFVDCYLPQFISAGWDQAAYRIYYAPLWRRLLRLGVPLDFLLRLGYSRLHPVVPFRWDRLPLEYNWKPYWGANEEARIVHFHGPKPSDRPPPGTILPPAYRPFGGGAYEHYGAVWDELLEQAQ